ncbi:MAG: cation transporter, partial [Anaerolineae bacterium]
MKYLNLLLIFIPLAIATSLFDFDAWLVFVSAALGIIPLAGILGRATEELALHAGPRVGGLLNATLGNAAELIITIFAIREGLLELAKASITGSILGNVLLVLGLSILFGGLRHGTQRFDRSQARLNATMMTLAVIALVIPAIFGHAIESDRLAVEELSLGVAGVMIIIYTLSLIYSFRSVPATETVEVANWSLRLILLALALSTLFMAWLSEILVETVEPVVQSLGVTEFFLGVII